jgi:hypothetical protein
LQRSFSSHSQMRLYFRLGDFPTRYMQDLIAHC